MEKCDSRISHEGLDTVHTLPLFSMHTQKNVPHTHAQVHPVTSEQFTCVDQQVCDMFNYGWIMNIISGAQTWCVTA